MVKNETRVAPRLLQLLTLAGLLILIAGVFSPILHSDFTNLDDPDLVLNNPLTQGISREIVEAAFSTCWMYLYAPLAFLLVGLQRECFGLSSAVVHVTTLLLHLGSVLLLYGLAKRLLASKTGAILVAMLFALHPLHAESIGWATGQRTVLYGFFCLLSTSLFTRYIDSAKRCYWVFSLLSFLCACLSKGIAFMLPLTLTGLAYFVMKQPLHRVLRQLAPFFLFALLFAITAWGAASDQMVKFSTSHRLQLVSHGLMFYIGKAVLPLKLSCIYPFPKAVAGKWPHRFRYAPIAALLTLLWVIFVLRYDSVMGFALSWFILYLLPVLQWVTVGLPIIACDHFMYLPLAGLCLFIGRLWVILVSKSSQKLSTLLLAMLVVVVVLLGSLTFIQVGIWKNSIQLFQHTLKYYPEIRVAKKQLGLAFMTRERWQEADTCFSAMIQKDPNDGEAWLAESGVLFYLKDIQGALHCAEKAVQLLPENTSALELLAALQAHVKSQ